jgi:NAD(P)-dependent dehydrogenase (short-subunit alcohol dehydrogenase family)
MRLQHKIAIVTGAGSGIGKATAILFSQEGAGVVIADIDGPGGEKTASEITQRGGEALFVQADISKEPDARSITDQTMGEFGRVDVLVNNAATFVLKGFDATVEEWQCSVGVNVIGTVLVTKYAVEAMKDTGGGAIVNMASISSWVAQSNFLPYSATKAAILQMTRNMAMDFAPDHIRVNCVCPGTILTPQAYRYMERTGITLEEFNTQEGEKTFLKRVGQAQEVAQAVLFLVSDEASYITGTHLMVDGGYTAM